MTPRQLQVAVLIRDYTAEHHYAPTLAEIGKAVGRRLTHRQLCETDGCGFMGIQ